MKRACFSESHAIPAGVEVKAKSEKVIFICRGNSSTLERKYLFSVSVYKYFINTKTEKAERESGERKQARRISSTESFIGKTSALQFSSCNFHKFKVNNSSGEEIYTLFYWR